MQEKLAKIRWNIDFILSELDKIPGSDAVKNDVRSACSVVNIVLLNSDNESEIKAAIGALDAVIDRIKENTENQMIFLLLITHVADMKFLFLSEERQKEILAEIESNKAE